MSGITKLQGSIIVKEDVTIRVIRSGSDLFDFALTAGMEFDSVDKFLNLWQAQLTAAISGTWAVSVNTSGASKGKITIDAGTGTFNILWTHAGSSTEGERIRNFLGEAANATGVGASYTFAAAHKAGFYPLYGASALERQSWGYGLQSGLSADGSVWSQTDLEPIAEGNIQTFQGEGEIEIGCSLQLDGSTDWAELGSFCQFVDDVFDYMGEPFSIVHKPYGAAAGSHYTGYFSTSPIEIFGERRSEAYNGLLDLRFDMIGRVAPGLQSV